MPQSLPVAENLAAPHLTAGSVWRALVKHTGSRASAVFRLGQLCVQHADAHHYCRYGCRLLADFVGLPAAVWVVRIAAVINPNCPVLVERWRVLPQRQCRHGAADV